MTPGGERSHHCAIPAPQRADKARKEKKKRNVKQKWVNLIHNFFVVDQEDGDVGQQNYSQPAVNGPDIGMGARREKAVFNPTGQMCLVLLTLVPSTLGKFL